MSIDTCAICRASLAIDDLPNQKNDPPVFCPSAYCPAGGKRVRRSSYETVSRSWLETIKDANRASEQPSMTLPEAVLVGLITHAGVTSNRDKHGQSAADYAKEVVKELGIT